MLQIFCRFLSLKTGMSKLLQLTVFVYEMSKHNKTIYINSNGMLYVF